MVRIMLVSIATVVLAFTVVSADGSTAATQQARKAEEEEAKAAAQRQREQLAIFKKLGLEAANNPLGLLQLEETEAAETLRTQRWEAEAVTQEYQQQRTKATETLASRDVLRAWDQARIAESGPKWWEVLGLLSDASEADCKRARARVALARHPDRGGDVKTMQDINNAVDECKADAERAAERARRAAKARADQAAADKATGVKAADEKVRVEKAAAKSKKALFDIGDHVRLTGLTGAAQLFNGRPGIIKEFLEYQSRYVVELHDGLKPHDLGIMPGHMSFSPKNLERAGSPPAAAAEVAPAPATGWSAGWRKWFSGTSEAEEDAAALLQRGANDAPSRMAAVAPHAAGRRLRGSRT